MFEQIEKNKGNRFFHVEESLINSAQNEMGIIFPNELVAFYKQVGYGFIKSQVENYNRIMDPKSVSDFRFRKGQFGNDPELDMFDSYEKDRIIFFEICEGSYLSIGFSKTNNGNVFYGNKIIAESLEKFLIDYQENENYFD